MSLTGDLITYILNDETIQGLINDNLFDMFVPEDTPFPFCVFERDAMMIEDHLLDITALRKSDYSLTIAGENSIQTEAVEEAFITLLASVRGVIGNSNVRVIYYNGSEETSLQPVDGSEESTDLITMRFEVHWFKS